MHTHFYDLLLLLISESYMQMRQTIYFCFFWKHVQLPDICSV